MNRQLAQDLFEVTLGKIKTHSSREPSLDTHDGRIYRTWGHMHLLPKGFVSLIALEMTLDDMSVVYAATAIDRLDMSTARTYEIGSWAVETALPFADIVDNAKNAWDRREMEPGELEAMVQVIEKLDHAALPGTLA